MGRHSIPCVRGVPFWTDLMAVRRLTKAKNLDMWHHSDQNLGRMAFLVDRYFTHFVCLLQLTRCRDEKHDEIVRLLDRSFAKPSDFLQRAPPIMVVPGLELGPAVDVGVTPLEQEDLVDPVAPVTIDEPNLHEVLPEAGSQYMGSDAPPGIFEPTNLRENVVDEQPLSARGLCALKEKRATMGIPENTDDSFDSRCTSCNDELCDADRIAGGGCAFCAKCRVDIEANSGVQQEETIHTDINDIVADPPLPLGPSLGFWMPR